jgi:hypothetical protein
MARRKAATRVPPVVEPGVGYRAFMRRLLLSVVDAEIAASHELQDAAGSNTLPAVHEDKTNAARLPEQDETRGADAEDQDDGERPTQSS